MKTTRLSKGASKLDLYEAHLIKMGAKKINRNRMYELMKDDTFCMANLSINHPDYGVHPSQHEKNKLSEKSS